MSSGPGEARCWCGRRSRPAGTHVSTLPFEHPHLRLARVAVIERLRALEPLVWPAGPDGETHFKVLSPEGAVVAQTLCTGTRSSPAKCTKTFKMALNIDFVALWLCEFAWGLTGGDAAG